MEACVIRKDRSRKGLGMSVPDKGTRRSLWSSIQEITEGGVDQGAGAGRERSGSFGICVHPVVLLLMEMSPFLLKYKHLTCFAHLMS